jgi:hypothetical protein
MVFSGISVLILTVRTLYRFILCRESNVRDDLGLDIIRADIVVESTSYAG